jgi:protein O-mannosyl-transferase
MSTPAAPTRAGDAAAFGFCSWRLSRNIAPMLDGTHKPRATFLICLLLALVTLAIYWPVIRCEFINYDDPVYVTENPPVQAGLTWKGAGWAFTTGHASNWHPLTWLSLMLDSQLYGMKAGGYHATNLLFHVANTLLLFLLLRRMTGAQWRSAFVAALFALHPLHVESVAWVAERKDVLSTLFFLLTLMSYTRHAERKAAGSSEQRARNTGVFSYLRSRFSAGYWLALVLFALGLLSKPMLVTLPFVLLLLDYWPLGRISNPGPRPSTFDPRLLGRLVLEKVPFFVLSLAASVATFAAQERGGAVQALAALPLGARLENALISYAVYILKMFWPVNLALPYLYLPPSVWPAWHGIAAAVLLAGVSVLVVRSWRRRPYLAVGWLWFLGTLIPVIGIVQVGNASLADRYTYIPLLGLFIIAAWGGAELVEHRHRWRAPLAAAGLATVGACAVLTRVQLGFWHDSVALFGHAVKVTKDNCIAYNARAHALFDQGKLDEANADWSEALRIKLYYGNPYNDDLLYNIGATLTRQNKNDEALRYFEQAMQIKPTNPDVRFQLAGGFIKLGHIKEAITLYREGLSLNSKMPDALNNLAWILAAEPDPELRDGAEAVRLAEQACSLTGYRRAVIVGTLGAAYAEAGRFEEAAATAQKAESLATAAGDKELAEKNHKLAELFRSRQPYHESPQSAHDSAGTPPPQRNP